MKSFTLTLEVLAAERACRVFVEALSKRNCEVVEFKFTDFPPDGEKLSHWSSPRGLIWWWCAKVVFPVQTRQIRGWTYEHSIIAAMAGAAQVVSSPGPPGRAAVMMNERASGWSIDVAEVLEQR